MRLKQQHDVFLAKQASLEKKWDEKNAGIGDILKMLKNQS